MPEKLTIGTRKAFEKNYAFPYEKQQIESEIIYVCNKGSEWARANEVLILRCQEGTWTAYDGEVSADGNILLCRQAVFRCVETDITQPGWHTWQTNELANRDNTGFSIEWQGELKAETRAP